jgi:hypothetical protein
MTEQEWLAADDPTPLLLYLQGRGDSRRFWLFAAACCRHFPQLVEIEAGRVLVEAVEGHADAALLSSAVQAAVSGFQHWFPEADAPGSSIYLNRNLATALFASTAWEVAWKIGGYVREVVRITGRDERAENAIYAKLIRCIFGNPFRPAAVNPAWLRWNDGTVPRLARWIYGERRWAEMGILHDALLDAGCDDEGVLSHARERGAAHVRGCFVLDLLLTKE